MSDEHNAGVVAEVANEVLPKSRGANCAGGCTELVDRIAALSDDDRLALEKLDQDGAIVAARVRSVALRYRSSFYLFGRGGTGKSHIIRAELARTSTESRWFNSRMSGRALFNVLRDVPDAVHVLEDMERLLDDRDAQGVLRSAAGSGDGEQRTITWSTDAGVETVVFRGGLIVVSNRPIGERPVLRAIATRFSPLEWNPTDRELAALMRRIAINGYAHKQGDLPPNQCLEIAEFLIEGAREQDRALDLRLMFHGFLDRIQWARRESAVHWQDLLTSMISQQPRRNRAARTRAARKRWEQGVVAEVTKQTNDRHEQIQLWKNETGKSEKAFYRRLREIESGVTSNPQASAASRTKVAANQ